MDLKVGVDPDGELGRGGVCHAGHGCLLSLAGWGTARAPAGRTALRGVWATGSYQVTSVRLACRWWPRPGPTGQPQGTRPDDSRVRPWPRPPRGLGWRPRLGSTGQEQGTQPADQGSDPHHDHHRDHRSGISTCRGIRPSGPPTRTPPTTAWAQASLASAHTEQRTLVHFPTPPPWPQARPGQQVRGWVVLQPTAGRRRRLRVPMASSRRRRSVGRPYQPGARGAPSAHRSGWLPPVAGSSGRGRRAAPSSIQA